MGTVEMGKPRYAVDDMLAETREHLIPHAIPRPPTLKRTRWNVDIMERRVGKVDSA